MENIFLLLTVTIILLGTHQILHQSPPLQKTIGLNNLESSAMSWPVFDTQRLPPYEKLQSHNTLICQLNKNPYISFFST